MGDSDSDAEAEKSSRVRGGKYSALRTDLSGALVAFDRAQDWADLIHDLQRVNRVLLKHESSSFVPDKVLLAKRLAQCLTPSLPSGVHLKALETYHIVFGRIGPNRLAKDLLIYSAGPFPLYAHAATALKGALLALYETHYIPLGHALRPIADGFVLALLPGLDDETSDFYEQTLALMSSLERAVDSKRIFHSALWRALLRSPSIRLSAASYLKLKMGQLAVKEYTGLLDDTKLLAMAIAAGLRDQDVLVQRATLELLVGDFPLDSDCFGLDKTSVVAAAMETLLRRELSLTKRVHAWLMGGSDGTMGTEFCRRSAKLHILDSVKDSIAKMYNPAGGDMSRITRPYKMVGALLDRQEIATCLTSEITLVTLESAARFSDEEMRREFDHAVGQLITQIGYDFVFDLLEKRLQTGRGVLVEMDYRIMSKATTYLPVQDKAVRVSRLPRLVSLVVDSMGPETDSQALYEATELLLVIFGNLGSTALQDDTNETIHKSLAKFAAQFDHWLASFRDKRINDDGKDHSHSYISSACLLLSGVSHRAGQEAALTSLNASLRCISFVDDPGLQLSGTRAFVEIAPQVAEGNENGFLDEKILAAVRGGWSLLCPASATSTAFAAELWISLQKKFPNITEEVISSGILSSNPVVRRSNLEIFARLWNLVEEHHLGVFPADSGVYLMLDAISDDRWATRALVVSWLRSALKSNPGKVLDVPLRLLLTPETSTTGHNYVLETVYDGPRAIYAFKLLRSILSVMVSKPSGQQKIRPHFEESQPSSDVLAAVAKLYGHEDPSAPICLSALFPAPDYTTVMALASLGIIRATAVNETEHGTSSGRWLEVGLGETRFTELHSVIKSAAAEFLGLWIEFLAIKRESSLQIASKIADPCLRLLSQSVESKDLVLQLRLIDVIEGTLLLEGPGFSPKSSGQFPDSLSVKEMRYTAVERSPNFVPTLLQGLRSATKPSAATDETFFTQESIGLRKRWVSFSVSCITLVGVSLPAAMEKVVSLLCQCTLEASVGQRGRSSSVDERLDLLEGIAQISAYVSNCYTASFPRSGLPAEATASYSVDNTTAGDKSSGVLGSGRDLTTPVATGLSSLNPLRFLNDFVKDVFVGNGGGESVRMEDPRKAAARIMFGMLPLVVAAAVSVWVPQKNRTGFLGQNQGRSPLKRAVMSVLEMWFQNHPIDLMSAFVVLWNKKRVLLETTHFIVHGEDLDQTRGTMMEVLISLSVASPPVISQGLCKLLDLALVWDENSPGAVAGRSRRERLAADRPGQGTQDDNTSGQITVEPEGSAHALFSAGDFFAENDVMGIELATLSLLNAFLLSSTGEDSEFAVIWTAVSTPMKDILASNTRPMSQILLLPLMSSLCSLTGRPLTDKRHRKDFLQLGGQVIAACSAIASGQVGQNSPFLGSELSQVRSVGGGSDSKPSSFEERQKFLTVRALSCMPRCVFTLLDGASSDDRAGAVGHFAVAVAPCLAFLKTAKTFSRPTTEDDGRNGSWKDEADVVGSMAAASVLLEAAECHWASKTVRKEFIALLEDADFFKYKVPIVLSLLARVCNAVFVGEKSQMVNIGNVSNAPGVVGGGLTAVFAGRDAEIALRARSIRRISFCLFAGEDHSYKSHIGPILEKLRDSLRIGAPRLTEEAFLCLRVLLLRSGPSSIAPFRATVLGELTRVLSAPTVDLTESVAAFRFVDLLALLAPPEFAYDRCFFFAESEASEDSDESTPGFEALVSRIARQWDGQDDRDELFRQHPTRTVIGGRLRGAIDDSIIISFAGHLNARVVAGGVHDVDLTTIGRELSDEFIEEDVTAPGELVSP